MYDEESKLRDITVRDLREIISEEFMKHSYTPAYISPYYYSWQPSYPYQHQEVWATTNTVEDKEMLRKRQKYSFNTVSNEFRNGENKWQN